MKKLDINIIVFMIYALFLVSCQQDKMPLPVSNTDSVSFGANDTNYVELQPIWDHAGFSHPVDAVMGPDGLIFVADEGNNRIIALSKSGAVQNQSGMDAIGPIEHPRGVSIDSRLNLLVVNGSNTVYCWNQYINMKTIDSVATEVLCYDAQKKDTVICTFDELVEASLKGEYVPVQLSLIFRAGTAASDTVKSVYPIYTSKNGDAQFNGVAAAPYGVSYFYVTESTKDNIQLLVIYPQLAVKSRSGEIVFYFKATSVANIASYGSGAGTVDNPQSIVTDDQGNVYFTQFGGNFLVQKLSVSNYKSEYVLYQHNIMDLNRFVAPYDIALDDDNNIFVLDTGEKKVFKFGNSGTKAGQLLDLGKKGLALAEFEDARGLIVEDNVVYVVESGMNRIRRFQYSISDSDIPDTDENP